jgi:hypothetical protein
LCWGVLKGSGAMREVSRDMVGRDFSIKRRFVAHRTVASVASGIALPLVIGKVKRTCLSISVRSGPLIGSN